MSTARSPSARADLLTFKICGRLFNRHEHLERHSRTRPRPRLERCSRMKAEMSVQIQRKGHMLAHVAAHLPGRICSHGLSA